MSPPTTTSRDAVPARRPDGPGVSVAELRAAWHAVADGHFRHATTPTRSTRPGPPDPAGLDRPGDPERVGGSVWCPPVLVTVLGCHGSAGASALALAVATAAQGPVRVVDAAGPGRSGLSGAATAELGPTGTGWVRGQRDEVVLDRLATDHPGPAHLPPPGPYPHPHPYADPEPDPGGSGTGQVPVVLDLGWDAHVLARAGGWLAAALASSRVLVLVTTATVPGMARLDAALHTLYTLDPPGLGERRVVVAVRGPLRRRWPRQVSGAPGPQARDLLERSLAVVPHCPGLAVRGLDTGPLPASLVAAGARILALTGLSGLTGVPPQDPPTPQDATVTAADGRAMTTKETARPGPGRVVHDEAPHHHHAEGDTHVR
ncbi:hypothetical protein ACQE98_16180 [Ornithinimicrobium sp. W1679]|uniref:hypothetical protein n=1 Tax=Ornithinimicrobium sp. W1679 TaxID=3418770 RepID=UPI003CFA197C